jgi:signal transduction histidine kinase
LEEILRAGMMLAHAVDGIQASLHCEGSWPSMHADSTMLHQVFSDLVRNAIAAIEGDGTVTMHVERTRHREAAAVAIRVTDDGPGMSQEEASLAMTPFFTTRANHAGLGLAISQRVVEAHGGKLVIDDTSDTGTTLQVTLPLEPEVVFLTP